MKGHTEESNGIERKMNFWRKLLTPIEKGESILPA